MTKAARPVVATIIGNLGNQLFEFAAAKALQSDPDQPVALDTRLRAEWPLQLDWVLRSHQYRPASSAELLKLRQVPRLPRLQRTTIAWRDQLADRAPALFRLREFSEAPQIGFDQRIADVKPPILLRGYFQSERYFDRITPEIFGAFKAPGPRALGELRRLQTQNTADLPLVGVSLRTGQDYGEFDFVLPGAFYDDAIDRITKDLGPCFFAIFGDVEADCDSFARHLGTSRGCHAESVAALSPADQLALLSLADHLVISNSSFAWWGAWLGDQRASGNATARHVLYPDPWLRESDRIAPDRWTPIPRAFTDTTPSALLTSSTDEPGPE
jgi:hypothetical protein